MQHCGTMRKSKAMGRRLPVTPLLKNRFSSAAAQILRVKLSVVLILALFDPFALTVTAGQSPANSAALKKIQELVDHNQIDAAEHQLWDIVTREPENASAIRLLGSIRVTQKRLP